MFKRLLLLLAFLILLSAPGGTSLAQAQSPVVRFFVFYAQDCTACQAVRDEILAPLCQKYGDKIEIRQFEISVPENYEALLRLEREHGVSGQAIPEIFIGQDVLVGEEEIKSRLEGIIEGYLASGGTDFPSDDIPLSPSCPPSAPTPCPEEQGFCPVSEGPPYPVYLAYFYRVGCMECERVTYDLSYLEKKYPNLRIERFKLESNFDLNEALGERYGVAQNKRLTAPAIFIGQDYLIGDAINAPKLETLIEKYSPLKSVPPWEGVEETQAKATIIQRFLSFSALTILGAGLVDGLNPCAFATIIFFVSYLAMVGRRGREIILVGASFTGAVFLTYLLMGLGVLRVVQSVTLLGPLSRLIYGFTALLCLTLAGFSLYDYYKIKQGRMEEMSLRLPRLLQRRVHKVIRETTNMPGYIGASFIAGFLVSLLEFACTGQVYLPTIIFVSGVPELRAQAIVYLLLYNLVFVLPLIVVFLLAFYGTSSLEFSRFLGAHAGKVRLLTTLLFLLLGLWLILAII